jgi:hypothetical protein
MSDGAHLGVNVDDALKVVMGAAEEADVAHESTAVVAARVMSTTLEHADSYSGSANWVARQLVELARADPTVIGSGRDLYDVLKERIGEGAPGYDVLTSLTRFQWGWAENTARAILELPPVPNPAILTIE